MRWQVDLNPKSALIPRKLLIFQKAKMAKTATKAILSFSFHSVFHLIILARSNVFDEMSTREILLDTNTPIQAPISA